MHCRQLYHPSNLEAKNIVPGPPSNTFSPAFVTNLSNKKLHSDATHQARTHKQTNKKFLTFRGTTTRRRLTSNPKKLMIQLQKTTTDIWVGCFVFFHLLVQQVRSNQQTIAVIEKERKTCIVCKLHARWQTQRQTQRKDDVGWGAIVSYRNKRHDLWQQHPTRCLASRSLCSSSSKCSLSLRLLVVASERAMYCEPPGSNKLPATRSCCCCGGGGEHRGVVESIDGYQRGVGFSVCTQATTMERDGDCYIAGRERGTGPGGGGRGGKGRKELGLFVFLVLLVWDFSFLFLVFARATTTVLSQGYIFESSTFNMSFHVPTSYLDVGSELTANSISWLLLRPQEAEDVPQPKN